MRRWACSFTCGSGRANDEDGAWVRRLLCALLLSFALASPLWADEYGKGWCDAWTLATEASMRNRDHWRKLSRLPVMTHEEVLQDIRAGWPPAHCQGLPTMPERVACVDGASLDLYVVLPPLTAGTPGVTLPDGRTITCPSGERAKE